MMHEPWTLRSGGPITSASALTEPHDGVRWPVWLGNTHFLSFFHERNRDFWENFLTLWWPDRLRSISLENHGLRERRAPKLQALTSESLRS
jgi:hypothetical protein